jgi:uncharacterized protein YbcC (UPF0753/DUF2309 family)
MYDNGLQPGEAFREELQYQESLESDKEHQELMEQDRQAALDEILRQNEIRAKAQADKILKKNKREIDRLLKWIYKATEEGNYPAYDYALRKLRKIYRQPVTDELVKTMYETTRQQIRDIIHAATKEI